MRRFIRYIITIMLMVIILFEGIIGGVVLQKKGVFHSSYQSVIADKYRMLQKTDEKKIIMVAGSSSAFGLDQYILEAETGYKVINLGLYAGFGSLFYTELAKENLNPGDIVLLGYEYGWQDSFSSLGQDVIMSGIDENIHMYKHIPISHWPDFIGYLFKYAEKKNSFEEAHGIYSRESFDENGQLIRTRANALSDYEDKVSTYGIISVLDSEGNVTISDRSVEYLRELKEYVSGCGASIYFVAPPILYDSIACNPDDFLELAKLEEERIGIPYISDPRLYMFPADLMSDTVNHCNSEGEKIRTNILVDDLKLCGAISGSGCTDELNINRGETCVLVDTLPKRLLYKPVDIKRVYAIVDGVEHNYYENVDYIIDYERGTIRRTQGSNIPNYLYHNVIWKDGKFKYINGPDLCNPESNIKYQIRIDYDYYITKEELEPLENSSYYLSKSLRQKLEEGDSINVALCGDGIGAGVDTDGEGIFLNYLSEALSSYYGVEIETKNYSEEGRCCDLLNEKINDIISDHPDVLMIEFGINDHYVPQTLDEENVKKYKDDIEKMVVKLKENDIDVFLFGFFQQNITLSSESMEATKSFNKALREIADNNGIYFADVYALYLKIGSIKPLSRDVMSDYIHHPNEWGHKLYFTSIIEAFNIYGTMRPIDFENYIFI